MAKETASPETGNVAKLQGKAKDVGQQAREVYDATREQAIERKERTEAAIQQRPFLSTAAAFGAGMVVAALLNRR